MGGLLLFSWNVASWPTALGRIRSYHGSLEAWLARHGCDVLALQEVKMTKEKLEGDPGSSCKHLEGWDTFWAPCRDGRKGKSGFNGVATLARKGLTMRADRAPLREEDLDAEGRCLMTDHGDFCLFNVYAPSGGATTPARKMRFFRALRAAMARERGTGKAVVLCGDLNLSRRAVDCAPGWALVPLEHVWGSREAPGLAALPPHVADAVFGARQRAEWCLRDENRKLECKQGKSSGANGAYVPNQDQYSVKVPTDETKQEWVPLGKWDTAEGAERDIRMDAISVDDGEGGAMLYRGAGCLHADTLRQLLRAAGCELSDDHLAALVAAVGYAPSGVCFREWIEALLREDRMVDTFAEVRPDARGRFTCWHQYTNRRYENEGTRIDYFLVDGVMAPAVRAGGTLPGGDVKRAAWNAAVGLTPGGQRFHAAPFDGSGMQEAPTTVLDMQFADAHTGIVYTPPNYSDHVAVSLLLEWGEDDAWRGPRAGSLALAADKATRACQPHRASRSVKDMFARHASSTKAVATATGAAGEATGPTSVAQPLRQQARPKRGTAAAHKRGAATVATMFARLANKKARE